MMPPMMPPMHASVYANGVLVGHADLEWIDVFMGVCGGPFHPGEGYDAIRPVVLELMRRVWARGATADAARLREAYRQHDALELEVRTPEGAALHPATIHIEDASGLWKDVAPRIELQGLPSAEVRRHFGDPAAKEEG
jgi:hypothetical protein